MKVKFCRIVLAGLVGCLGVSCTTAYDYYGQPQQVVDPGVAIAVAAAVGLLAYGLGNSGDDHYRHSHPRHYDHGYYGHGGYYSRPSYYQPYDDEGYCDY